MQVIKRDHTGNTIFSYECERIDGGVDWVCLQAHFEMDSVDLSGSLQLCRGDLMTEWFYADRYYNIFQIQNPDTLSIKGWYCNITRPAEIVNGTVVADDLALDMLVDPDGVITLLDKEEFNALDLPQADRCAALDAVVTLRDRIQNRQPPFDRIADA
jgi:uncharacterized protein